MSGPDQTEKARAVASVRLTAGERQRLRIAAARKDMTLSTYIREAALEREADEADIIVVIP